MAGSSGGNGDDRDAGQRPRIGSDEFTVGGDVAPDPPWLAEDTLERLARGSSPESTLRRIEAIAACGEALDRNVPPLLAVEAMTMALRSG